MHRKETINVKGAKFGKFEGKNEAPLSFPIPSPARGKVRIGAETQRREASHATRKKSPRGPAIASRVCCRNSEPSPIPAFGQRPKN